MPDIVMTEFMDDGPAQDMKAKYEVHWDKNLCEKPEEIKTLLPDARALVARNRTKVNEDTLAAGPDLKVIGQLGVGLDNINLEACERHGTTVCPATGSNHVPADAEGWKLAESVSFDDLIAALKSSRIGGVALDVFADEPLTEQSAAKFADVPNLIMTPHISGVRDESIPAISTITANNIPRVLGETS